MATNKDNDLFPEQEDPKRKLRAFSRAPSVSAQQKQPQPKKQPTKKKQSENETTNHPKPKRIVVKGYDQTGHENKEAQEQAIIRQGDEDDLSAENTLNGAQQSTEPTTINTAARANVRTSVTDTNPTTSTNLRTIREEPREDHREPCSKSSLEYIEERKPQDDSSDEERNWEKLKRIKREPVDEQNEERRILMGLVSSPSLSKGERRVQVIHSSKAPTQAQAAALLEIRSALDKNNFKKHTELMTAYLLKYNPEKLRVLAIKKEEPQRRQPASTNQQTTQNGAETTEARTPAMAEPKKTKPARAAERKIPPGRPMSESDNDGDICLTQTNGGGGFVENSIEFTDGKVPSHHMTHLTVFWDNRIRKIKGYIRISMFNKAWLEANRDIEGKKSTKKKNKDEDEESDEEKYEGLSYPVELRLTYGDWVTCFNLFLNYLRNWFNFERLVLKFKGHKKNVEKVKAENNDNWMVALRYDIMIRRQFWTTRVEGGKVADPSVRQKRIEEQARRTVDKFREWDCHDNPYAKGGKRQDQAPQLSKIAVKEPYKKPEKKEENLKIEKEDSSYPKTSNRGGFQGRRGRGRGRGYSRGNFHYREHNRYNRHDREEDQDPGYRHKNGGEKWSPVLANRSRSPLRQGRSPRRYERDDRHDRYD
ncbi:hypothetical protein DFH28DRAFT_888078 [Melampsora americana]|nr:hypothetical protein DFH28DRAFT_888078 [Melampsora americana]